MKKIIVTFLLSFAAPAISAQMLPGGSFKNPPDEYRPHIFWVWMNDLVTKKGIKDDLDAFRDFGLQGTLVMLVGGHGDGDMTTPHGMADPIAPISPEFFDAWKYAAEVSAANNMTMVSQLGPGWCHSGGPWIQPGDAVQHLAYTDRTVAGPVKGASFLATAEPADKGIGFVSAISRTDDTESITIDLGRFDSAVSRVDIHPYFHEDIEGFGFPLRFKLELSDNPEFRNTALLADYTESDFKNPKNQVVSFSGDPAKYGFEYVRYIRFTTTKNYRYVKNNKELYFIALGGIELFSPEGNRVGMRMSSAAASSVGDLSELADTPDAGPGESVKMQSKVAETSDIILERPGYEHFTRDIAVVAFPAGSVIDPKKVVELKPGPDGRFVWDIPEGNWTVRRYAIRNALAYNRPAPKGGHGLECDKLERSGVDSIWNGMVGRFIADSPHLAGTVIRGVEADSWEVGNPEWSKSFRNEFMRRRGYDPVPWLMAYKSNQTVGSKELSERFREDIYLTQTDMFADNFFSHMYDKCDSLGMEFMTEPYYGPFDPVRCGGRTHVPMGEVWASGECLLTLRWASSAANTYGRKAVGGETFTGRWNDGAWRTDPYALKRIGDLSFSNGLNRIYLHATALQPWGDCEKARPGMPMRCWGTMFTPGQTWIGPGREWVDYLTRCQYILSQGIAAKDIAFVMPTLDWKKTTPGGTHKLYDYDLLSEELFIHGMSWSDGYFRLPSGARYRILILPDTNGKSSVEFLTKLKSLISSGGIVFCQDKPHRAEGLRGYPESDAKVRELVAEIWSDCDGLNTVEHALGKGKLIWAGTWNQDEDPETSWYINMRPPKRAFWEEAAHTTRWSSELLAALDGIGLPPDVDVLSARGRAFAISGRPDTECGMREGNDAIAWIHRRTDFGDVYFLSNQTGDAFDAKVRFRISGKKIQIWDAETNRHFRIDGEDSGIATILTLPMEKYGSLFVVFSDDDNSTMEEYRTPQIAKKDKLEDWSIEFGKGLGAPEGVMKTVTGSWTESDIEGIRYFSGTATYSTSFIVGGKDLRRNDLVRLDLGRVRNLAEVYVNGRRVATMWKEPFVCSITDYVKPGKNDLQVKVTNTWTNRMIGDEQYPADTEWDDLLLYYGQEFMGYKISYIPDWIWTDGQRPVKERVSFTTWRFYEKDSPLEESGLLTDVFVEYGHR